MEEKRMTIRIPADLWRELNMMKLDGRIESLQQAAVIGLKTVATTFPKTKKGETMRRAEVEKMAAKVGLELDETTAREAVENDGARWVLRQPGMARGRMFFDTLAEAYDYAAIEREGQLK